MDAAVEPHNLYKVGREESAGFPRHPGGTSAAYEKNDGGEQCGKLAYCFCSHLIFF
jgi:hypothetical protein